MSQSDTEEPSNRPTSVWSSRQYRIYAPSWFAMVLANQIEMVTLGIYLYTRTQDPMALGWLGLARALPVVLLAPGGGHLADRLNRQRLFALTLLVQAFCGAVLAVAAFRNTALSWVYAVIVVEAATGALGTPARAALLPLLVPASQFSKAVAWNSSIFQMGTMIGPALGGIILGRTHDFAMVLFLVAAARAVALVGILFLRPRPQMRENGERSAQEEIWEGLKFVWHHKPILGAISLDLFAVLLGGVTYILPVFAEDILKVGATGLGFLRSAEALGAITMAMILAHAPPMRHAGRNMLLAVTGFGLATIIFALSRNFWLSFAMMFLIGALDNVSVVVRHTLVQMLTPDHMRGRVSAVNSVFIVLSNDLGGLESGVTAKLFGAVGSAIIGGTGAILAVLVALKLWPELARIGRLDEVETLGQLPNPPEKENQARPPTFTSPAPIVSSEAQWCAIDAQVGNKPEDHSLASGRS
ncbi:MFS transporter [Thermogutta sp.]|uniref:MFS transporter n=1 Tax=Thermogutta sp. TaxID=1962930 RepID=UPI003C7BA2B9